MLQLESHSTISLQEQFHSTISEIDCNVVASGQRAKKAVPTGWGASLFKRLFDVIVGLTSLMVLLPFLLTIGLLTKLSSEGPALFRQQRRGLNGKLFTIYKFRTMSVLEDGHLARQAQLNDPRVTKIGRILRKLSIDELPQLLNIVFGDMSIVGPRPHAPAQDSEFSNIIPEYMNRYSVKPGLTGLAQVEGARGETSTTESMQKRVDLDIQYIIEADLILDLKIIARTAFMIFFRPNGV